MTPIEFQFSHRRCVMLLALLALLWSAGSTTASAQKEKTLYSFGANGAGVGDGDFPLSGLTRDSHGNLYGTTEYGGAYGLGTVFELSPPSQEGGAWTETILHSFQGYPTDGRFPIAGVVFDESGNLYGTTSSAGQDDLGAVYELAPTAIAGSSWTESLIYSFTYVGSGATTTGEMGGGVVFVKGNLYVVTLLGGNGNGNVLELKPPSLPGGSWQVGEIFAFSGGSDGFMPLYGGGALIADPSGNLYGTGSGSFSPSLVFELSPPSAKGNPWTETVLYSLDTPSGAPLIFDRSGNLYGTAAPLSPGDLGGMVFELSPPHGGEPWTETTIYSFDSNKVRNGYDPYGGLILDKAGNLYGTTYEGGSSSHCNTNGCGTVFELSPPINGSEWTETVLHSFAGSPNDGALPFTNLTMDSAGRLYGTTVTGGAFETTFGIGGTVFQITP